MSTNLLKARLFSLSMLALIPFSGGPYASDNEDEEGQIQTVIASQTPVASEAEEGETEGSVVAEIAADEFAVDADYGFATLSKEYFAEKDEKGQEKTTSMNVSVIKELGKAVYNGFQVFDFLSDARSAIPNVDRTAFNPLNVDKAAEKVDQTTSCAKSAANSLVKGGSRALYYPHFPNKL